MGAGAALAARSIASRPRRPPARLVQHRRPLEREAAQAPGRQATGHHRRLDGQGAGAREGIDQRARPVPSGRHEERPRQILAQGRLRHVQAVAPAVERRPRGVDGDHRLVSLQPDGDRHPFVLGIEPIVAQPDGDGAGDPLSDGAAVVQPALLGAHPHRPRHAGRQEALPRQRRHLTLQRVEPGDPEAADPHEHVRRQPALQVGAIDHAAVATRLDASRDDGGIERAERRELMGQKRLEPGRAAREDEVRGGHREAWVAFGALPRQPDRAFFGFDPTAGVS